MLIAALLGGAPDAGARDLLCGLGGCAAPSLEVWPTFETAPLELTPTTLDACTPSPACLVEQVRALESVAAERGVLVLARGRVTVVGRTDQVDLRGFIEAASHTWLRLAGPADRATLLWSPTSALVARCWSEDRAGSTFGYDLPACELWDLARRVRFDFSGFVESVKGSSAVVAVTFWEVPAWCRRGLPSSAGGPPRRVGPLYVIRATVDLSGPQPRWVGPPRLFSFHLEGGDEALGPCLRAPSSTTAPK